MSKSLLTRLIALVVLLTLFPWSNALDAAPPAAQDGWIQLFNGKDLDGWHVKITGYDLDDNYGDTFRVEDGILKVAYDKDKYESFNGRFGHLIYGTPFSHYLLHVEYRFVGAQVAGGAGWAWRNSGIMIHGQSPESMRKDQDFPVSVEVQLLGGKDQGKRPTANVCTPGTNIVMDGKLITRHCSSSRSKTYRGDQWVTVEVEVHGDRLIKHMVNGRTVLSYTQPQLDPRDALARPLIKDGDKRLQGGYISLQSESHPVQFRKVAIKLLKD